MTSVTLNVDQWAEEQFASCTLGDRRRTQRLVQFAAQVAADPSGSTPKQTESWADCKAAYRLVGCEDVSFAAITRPHYQQTLARTTGRWLLIGDTTETHFSGKQVKGLGPTGNGGGRGFLLHSSLMVRPDGKQIVGLAGQVIRYRKRVKREAGGAQRLRRKDRESRIWSDLLEQIGQAPEGVEFVHVFDRGGDQFELYCRMRKQHVQWVVRAAQLQRWIFTPQGDRQKLANYLAGLPVEGQYTLELPANNDQPARTANLEVRFGVVSMPRPQHVSEWVKSCEIDEVSMWVVEAREVDPPQGVKAARWVLWSSLPVQCFADAWRTLEYYEKRPLIEEWHKALKSGCSLEDRQYETAKRLEAITGVLSVTAVRLLQLKMVARDEPERPAGEVIPLKWIAMLQRLRKSKPNQPWTVRTFYREMAKLGGFLGRKSDGEPGWITLWRGFEKLHLCLRGADTIVRKCG